MNSLSDNALMLKVKSGDLERMGLLFERYHRALYNFLFHMSRQKEASEDMVQTVFYRMMKYRSTFTGEGEFKTWMYHLARNVLADEMTKNKKHQQVYDIQDFASKIEGGYLADEAFEKNQQMNALELAMSTLSIDNREILVLSKYQELKYSEIAKLMNTSEGNIKVKIHRAISQLKNLYFKIEN